MALTGGRLSAFRDRYYGNEAGDEGGGLMLVDLDDPSGGLWNLWFIDNTAATQGGGLDATGDTIAFSADNLTFAGNAAATAGAGAHVEATDASGVSLQSSIFGWSDGATGVEAHGGATVAWCLAYATTSGVDYSGDAVSGASNNLTSDPVFRAWTNDHTDNDVLTLDSRSPALNSGPPDASWDDTDGSRNDRGATGGPYAN
jgi:predicted outer membrane repeat protein